MYSIFRYIRPRRGWRLLALVSACASLVSRAGPAPELQLLTAVVNIPVPAGSFDPATGQAEVTVARGLVLQVHSGSGWKLRMRAASSTFECVPRPAPGRAKNVSDLQLRNADGGQWATPSSSYVELAKGGATSGWREYAFDLMFHASCADAGGIYSVNLEFDFR